MEPSTLDCRQVSLDRIQGESELAVRDNKGRTDLDYTTLGTTGQGEKAIAEHPTEESSGGSKGSHFDAPRQAHAAGLDDRRRKRWPVLGSRGDQLSETCGSRRQVLSLENLQHGQTGGAGKRVGDKGRCVQCFRASPPGLHQILAAEDRTDGKTTGQRLAAAKKVGLHSLGFNGEPGTGAPETGKDLVRDEHNAAASTELGELAKPTRWRRQETLAPHHRLEEHATDVGITLEEIHDLLDGTAER
jgi:hypothetical protein